MDEQLQARRRLELDLRKAISNDELMLAYQPIVNLEAYVLVVSRPLALESPRKELSRRATSFRSPKKPV